MGSDQNLSMVFMLGKALCHRLYLNWAHTQLHLTSSFLSLGILTNFFCFVSWFSLADAEKTMLLKLGHFLVSSKVLQGFFRFILKLHPNSLHPRCIHHLKRPSTMCMQTSHHDLVVLHARKSLFTEHQKDQTRM